MNEHTSSSTDTSSTDATEGSQEDAKKHEQVLPAFIKTKTDKLLFIAFVLLTLYGLSLIPFRAKLLVDAPLLNVFLTGGNFSTLSLAAKNSDNAAALTALVIVAALSAIKFYPLYFLMGKRWGGDFLDMSFKNHKPWWFRALEKFIYKHPALALGLCFIPFSPVSPTIVVIIAGITKVKGLKFAVFCFIYSCLLKIFYVILGIIFGTQVLAVLQVIDKYMLWVTLALLAWLFIVVFTKEFKSEKSAAATEKDSPAEASLTAGAQAEGIPAESARAASTPAQAEGTPAQAAQAENPPA